VGDAVSAAGFIARATGKGGRTLHYDVTIDGVPGTFTDRVDEAAGAAPAIDGRGMVSDLEESKVTLDRVKRVQVGGGAVVRLLDRDDILAGLFAVRSRRVAFISAAETATDTTVSLSTTSGLSSSGVVYVSAETIAYTGKTGTTLTGCTRGAYGSRAQAHRGGAEQGASVYAVPPSWIGRRVRVTAYYDDDEGNRDTATETTVGVFRLEDSPTPMGNGMWELRCSHLSDELAKRKLGSGVKEMKPNAALVTIEDDAGTEVLQIVCDGAVGRMLTQRPATALGKTQALVTWSGPTQVKALYDIHDVTVSGAATIQLQPTARNAAGTSAFNLARLREALRGLPASNGIASPDALQVDAIKHVCILENGVPYILALSALTSILGDGTNGTYDVLPGLDPVALGEAGFRIGAGIPSAEIDTASLTATALSVPLSWQYPIDDEIPVGDFLRDLCRETNTAAVFSRAGQLTFIPLSGERATPASTIAEADCSGAITSTVVEGETYSRVNLSCNYDPVDGEYEGDVAIIDEEIAATYAPRENALPLESRTLVVSPVDYGGDNGSLARVAVSIDEIALPLRRDMIAYRGGALVVTMRLSAKHLLLNLGELVALSLPSVSDRRGGFLSSATGRVIERSNLWKGGDLSIEVSVLVEEARFYFAPHAEVASVAAPSGGTQVVTLSTTEIGNNATPARSFRVADELTVVSADGLTVQPGSARVLAIISDAVLEVADGSFGSALPLSAGQFLLLYLGSASTSDDGFTRTEYTYHDGVANAGGSTSRWR
jgi:hypothetical protein